MYVQKAREAHTARNRVNAQLFKQACKQRASVLSRFIYLVLGLLLRCLRVGTRRSLREHSAIEGRSARTGRRTMMILLAVYLRAMAQKMFRGSIA